MVKLKKKSLVLRVAVSIVLILLTAYVYKQKIEPFVQRVINVNLKTRSYEELTYTEWISDKPNMTLSIKGLDDDNELISFGTIYTKDTEIQVEYEFDGVSRRMSVYAKTQDGNTIRVLYGCYWFEGDTLTIEITHSDLLFDGNINKLVFTQKDAT